MGKGWRISVLWARFLDTVANIHLGWYVLPPICRPLYFEVKFSFLDRGRPGRPSRLRRTCFYSLSGIIDPKVNIKLSSSVVMQNDQITPPRVIVLSCAVAPRSKLFMPPLPLHISKVAKLIPVIQRSLQPKWSIPFKGSIISLSEYLQTQIASRSHQASRYNVSFDSPPEYLMDANFATGFVKIASFSEEILGIVIVSNIELWTTHSYHVCCYLNWSYLEDCFSSLRDKIQPFDLRDTWEQNACSSA